MLIRSRLASENDMMLLFNWANDPQTRKMSFTPNPIPLNEHANWLKKIINTPGTFLLIIEKKENGNWTPFSQVRIDIDGEISISVANEYRGKKLTTPALLEAIDFIKNQKGIEKLIAHIKPENSPSIAAFLKAGFVFSKETIVKGNACNEYTYSL